MAEKRNEPKDGNSKAGSKKLTRQEYDRLVQGVDDIYVGDESQAEQTPPLENPPEEMSKRDNEAK